jgi:hypothetical protein
VPAALEALQGRRFNTVEGLRRRRARPRHSIGPRGERCSRR